MWLRRHFLLSAPLALFGQGVVKERSERKPYIVLIAANSGMEAEKSLSRFAELLEGKHGMRCTILVASSPTELDGADALESADHSIWMVSGLRLPPVQLRHFQDYVSGPKPLIALGGTLDGFVNWPGFRSAAEKKKAKFSSVPLDTEALLRAVYAGLGRVYP